MVLCKHYENNFQKYNWGMLLQKYKSCRHRLIQESLARISARVERVPKGRTDIDRFGRQAVVDKDWTDAN